MGAAATDHLFLDGGHTIDFTNKAFEVLDHLGWEHAGDVLPTLAQETARARTGRRDGGVAPPRRPRRLLLSRTYSDGPPTGGTGTQGPGPSPPATEAVDTLAWAVLGDDPADIVAALDTSARAGRQRRATGPGRSLRRRPPPHPLPCSK